MTKKTNFANYRGQAGITYHKKHERGIFVDDVVAKGRAKKFQPFVSSNDYVLEYGVGTGINLERLVCQEKVGYDIAEDACRKKVESKGIYFTSDIKEVLSWQNHFDVVICHHVLEHVPNPTKELMRIGQILKPSGRLVLCVPFENVKKKRKFYPNNADMHLFSWNTQTICNLLLSASYNICTAEIRPFGYEWALAPLAKTGLWSYGVGLYLARLLRPVSKEIFVVAKLNS